jgi:hypothetical protein
MNIAEILLKQQTSLIYKPRNPSDMCPSRRILNIDSTVVFLTLSNNASKTYKALLFAVAVSFFVN